MFKPQYTSQGADRMKLNQYFSRAVYAINKAQYVATKAVKVYHGFNK